MRNDARDALGFGLSALSGLGQQNALGGGLAQQAQQDALSNLRQYGDYVISRSAVERNFSLRPQNNDVYVTTDGRQKVFVNGKWVYTGPTTLVELDTMPVREWLQRKTDEWLGD